MLRDFHQLRWLCRYAMHLKKFTQGSRASFISSTIANYRVDDPRSQTYVHIGMYVITRKE